MFGGTTKRSFWCTCWRGGNPARVEQNYTVRVLTKKGERRCRPFRAKASKRRENIKVLVLARMMWTDWNMRFQQECLEEIVKGCVLTLEKSLQCAVFQAMLPQKDQRDREVPKHWTLNLHPKNGPSTSKLMQPKYPGLGTKKGNTTCTNTRQSDRTISVFLHPTRAKSLNWPTMMAETRCFDHSCDHSLHFLGCQIYENILRSVCLDIQHGQL